MLVETALDRHAVGVVEVCGIANEELEVTLREDKRRFAKGGQDGGRTGSEGKEQSLKFSVICYPVMQEH